MQKRAWLFLVIVVCLPLACCLLGGVFFLTLMAVNDDRADKDELFAFVRENEEELRQAIETNDFSEFENQGFIREVDACETVVDFSCGGAGFGSETSYVGFYYTPDNDMTAVWCAPPAGDSLTPSGDGCEWRESDGDDRYYTEHICGNFYYYEASF